MDLLAGSAERISAVSVAGAKASRRILNVINGAEVVEWQECSSMKACKANKRC